MDYITGAPVRLWDHLSIVDQEHKSLTLVLWITVSFTIFEMIYGSLYRFIEYSTKTTAIPRLNRRRLVDSVWQGAFYSSLILRHVVEKWRNPLVPDVIETEEDVVCVLNNRSNIAATTEHDSHISTLTLIYYVIPLAFLIHQMVLSLSKIERERIYQRISLMVFLHTSNLVRCSQLGMRVLLLVSMTEGSRQIARIYLALISRRRGYEGPRTPFSFHLLSFLFFMIHICIWVGVNWYLFPILLMSATPAVSDAPPELRMPAAYLNIALYFYFLLESVQCPIIWALLFARSPSNKSMQKLEKLPSCLLLPYSTNLLFELRAVKIRLHKTIASSRPSIRQKRMNLGLMGKDEGTVSKRPDETDKDQTAGIISVVKCMMALKKKMRHRQEHRLHSPGSESLPIVTTSPASSSASSTSQELQEPQEQELPLSPENQFDGSVIDTFFSVPNITNTSENFPEKETETVVLDDSFEENQISGSSKQICCDGRKEVEDSEESESSESDVIDEGAETTVEESSEVSETKANFDHNKEP